MAIGDVKKQELDYIISNCEYCCEFLLELHKEELDPSKGNRVWNHALAVRHLIVLAHRLHSRCLELEGKLAAAEHENNEFKKGFYKEYVAHEVEQFKKDLISQIEGVLEEIQNERY